MSINIGNIFSARNLSEHMYRSLPKESTPHLKNPYDAIALLSHGCMLSVGFRLIGLGEDHKIGRPQYLGCVQIEKTDKQMQKQHQRPQTPRPSPNNGTPPLPTTMPFVTPTANRPSNIFSKSAAWAPKP